MKLYGNNVSPSVKRVRVLANELNINIEKVDLDFTKGDLKTPEYLAINPMGKIPTLTDDNGLVLWESPAILSYLAAKHNSPLLPKDAVDNANTLRWMFWNASHFENAVFAVAFEQFVKPTFLNAQPDQARVAAAQADWNRFAPVLNAQLEGKTWVLGNNFSIADICLGTTTEFSVIPQVGFNYAQFTHINAWLGRLQTRDTWKRASQ